MPPTDLSHAGVPRRFSTHQRKLLLLISGLLLAVSSLHAQGKANSDAKESGTTEEVTLQPFAVISDKDDSYEAVNFSSLSGTNRTLEKLPITAEVFNQTMLSDLAVTDVVNLLNNYATGVGPGEAGAGGPSATGTQDGDRFGLSSYTVRGLAVGPLRRDGFLSANNLGEGFSYDRVEIIRGPQSLLYGANPAGGIINVSTKKANFGRTFYQVQAQLDSLGSKRYQFDANFSGRWLNRRFALRTALLDSEAHQWRQNIQRKTNGQYIDLSLELIPASHTILELTAESKVNEGIESLSGALVTGIPATIPNSSKLTLLLARNDPALSSIANGFITWNNVDSLAGNSQLSRRIERHFSATLTSQLTPWLQGKIIAAKEPVKLDRLTPSGFTPLTAPQTGGNPLNTWAVGYAPAGNTTATSQQGVRALLTADFNLTRHVKNNLVIGGEAQSSPNGSNFNFGYYQVDANGKFVVNQANLNNATGGRTAMPVQWVDVTSDLSGYQALYKNSYTVNGVTYVRDWSKYPNAAFVAPGNPLGFNNGVSGATRAATHNQAGFAALFTSWFDGKVETMLGGRYDNVGNWAVSTGQSAVGNGSSGNAGVVWNVTKPVALYAGYSTSFTTPGSSAFASDIHGQLFPNGKGKGAEGGLKLNLFDGRLSGSATVFKTDSIHQNSPLSAIAIAATDPTGINGHYYTFNGPSIDYNLKTSGSEVELTARPARQLRVQFGYSYIGGKVGNAVTLPYLYNDQFNVNANGQVLLSDGTPLRVPISPSTPIATDGKSYSSSIATEVMTVSILKNGDAQGNYKASVDASNGRILNASAVGLAVPGVGTGQVGLPISQHQLGFVQPGGPDAEFLAQFGGDQLLSAPRHTFSLTAIYTFDSGLLKGLGVGANARVRIDTVLYYYSAGGVRRAFQAPDITNLNLIVNYGFKLTKRLGFKTQLNLNNVENRRYLTVYPDASTGAPVNANYRLDPRLLLWTNTLSF